MKGGHDRAPWRSHPAYPRDDHRRDRDEDRRPRCQDIRYKSEYERLREAEENLRAAQDNLREAQRGSATGDESSRSDPFPREEEYVRGTMGDHRHSRTMDVREPRHYDRERKREQRRNYEEETHHRRRRD